MTRDPSDAGDPARTTNVIHAAPDDDSQGQMASPSGNAQEPAREVGRGLDPADAANGSKVRRRQRMAAYGALFLLIASIGAATMALSKFIPSKEGTFYYRNGELDRGAEVRHLNPLLDIKLRILADYPVEKLSRARDTTIQQVNDAETFRAVYYNLFLLSD